MKAPKVIKDSPLKPSKGQQLEIRAVSDASTVLTRSFGPFGALVALICTTAFISIELARSDTAAIVIGTVAVAAILAVSFRRLSPP